MGNRPSIQDWCPPLPVLRKLGYRSRKEIDAEKCVFKALLGDFNVVTASMPDQAFSAAQQ